MPIKDEPKQISIHWKLPKHTSGCTNFYFQEWPARKPIYLEEYCENNQNFHSEAPVLEWPLHFPLSTLERNFEGRASCMKQWDRWGVRKCNLGAVKNLPNSAKDLLKQMSSTTMMLSEASEGWCMFFKESELTIKWKSWKKVLLASNILQLCTDVFLLF